MLSPFRSCFLDSALLPTNHVEVIRWSVDCNPAQACMSLLTARTVPPDSPSDLKSIILPDATVISATLISSGNFGKTDALVDCAGLAQSQRFFQDHTGSGSRHRYDRSSS